MIDSELLFPSNTNFSKSPHTTFLAESAKLAGLRIGSVDSNKLTIVEEGPVTCLLDGKEIIFDCKDWNFWCKADINKHIPYFKSHCLLEGYDAKNVFPNVPIMVYPAGYLNDYYKYRSDFNYRCSDSSIKNKQIPYGRALERRNMVHKLLKSNFKNVDINAREPIKQFWEAHKNCLSAVCVPGATNNMLDRGHLELIGLGVCTISPYIPTKLPYEQNLITGTHYLLCKDDYSDLINIIKWCMNHRDNCEKIGNNARQFFDTYLTPEKQWAWIKETTEEFYKKQ